MAIELDNNDPRVVSAMRNMAETLKPFLLQRCDGQSVAQMERIVEDLRSDFQLKHGYTFPPMTVFYLPSIGLVLFYRVELEDQEIMRKMLLLLRQLSGRGIELNAVEFSEAITRAWPNYKPPIEHFRADEQAKAALV